MSHLESDRKSVFLVGPMGAGKTTIGRQLAQFLRFEFVDSDHEVEIRTGATIPWIFDIEGEEGFRSREETVIEDLTRRPGIVLATGGGAVLREENRRHLQARGLVVYLYATLNVLYARTAKDRNRPLLQTEDPRGRLEALMTERDPLYRQVAAYVIDTGAKTARDTVREIAGLLDDNVRKKNKQSKKSEPQ